MTHVYHVWIRKLGKRWIFIFHIAFQYFQSMYWQEGTCEKELMITFWRSSMVSSQTLTSSYSMSCSLSSFFAAGFLLKSSTSEAICQRKLDSSSQKLLEPPSPWFSDSSSLSLSCLSMISLELPHHDDDVRLGDVPVILRSLWFAACTLPEPCTCTLPDARLLLASQFSRNKLPRHLLASRALTSRCNAWSVTTPICGYSPLKSQYLLPIAVTGVWTQSRSPKLRRVTRWWSAGGLTLLKQIQKGHLFRHVSAFNLSRHLSAQFKNFLQVLKSASQIHLKACPKWLLKLLFQKISAFKL